MLKKISNFSDKYQVTVNNIKVKVQRDAVVHVILMRAKNLARLNSNGKSSDPYCELSLGKEKVRSKMISKSIHPEWKECFDFNWYAGIGMDDLKVSVCNKNYWDLPMDDKMGSVVIDLKSLEVEQTHYVWKQLENGRGKIFLLITISGTTSYDSPTNLNRLENELERYELIADIGDNLCLTILKICVLVQLIVMLIVITYSALRTIGQQGAIRSICNQMQEMLDILW